MEEDQIRGKVVGRLVAKLFREHILGAVPILKAATAEKKVALAKAIKAWRVNAHKIAVAMNSLDSVRYSLADVERELNEHLDHTIAYASAVLGEDHEATIIEFEKARKHMSHFADIINAGVVAKLDGKT